MTTKNNKLFIFTFILPCLIVLSTIYFYPAMRTIIMTFFDVQGITSPASTWQWIGLDNYRALFRSRDFLVAVGNMVEMLVLGCVILIILSVILGIFLNARTKMPGRNFFRTMIYMPNMISAIAIGNAFYYFVFEERYGLLTTIWKFFGAEPIRWMTGNPKFYAMLIAVMFCAVGYYMLIMIAGLESIPEDLYEAAVLDGAGPIQKLWFITLPLMKGTLRNIVTFWSIGAMGMFTWVTVFTPIGTETATVFPINMMYTMCFGSQAGNDSIPAISRGATIGVFTAICVQLVYTISSRVFKTDDLEF